MLAMLRFAGFALACTMLVGCTVGTVDQIPVAPTPRLIRLTVTPTSSVTMIVGGSFPIVSSGGTPAEVVGAFAQYSDGSARYVEASWTSSDTSVVSVDGTTLTAVGRGAASVSATFQGISDDQQFVVLGGVGGNWAGTYVVEQCIGNSGATELMCAAPSPGRQPGFAYVGATLPIAMELTVSGGNVTGTVSFGNLRVPVTGQDRGGGFFSLRGAIQGAVALNITHWDAQALGDEMGGFIAYEVRFSGVNGTGSAASRLVNITRR